MLTGIRASATVINGSTLDRVMEIMPAHTVMLATLSITDGKASIGGGIRNQERLTLDHVIISGNTAGGECCAPGFDGGGIHSDGESLTIRDSTIREDRADIGSGGGVFVGAGALTITNSTVSDNKGIHGGGIQARGPLVVIKSTISGNVADFVGPMSGPGGGIKAYGSVIITNSTISGNRGQ